MDCEILKVPAHETEGELIEKRLKTYENNVPVQWAAYQFNLVC